VKGGERRGKKGKKGKERRSKSKGRRRKE